jgi:hypothetical protein
LSPTSFIKLNLAFQQSDQMVIDLIIYYLMLGVCLVPKESIAGADINDCYLEAVIRI